MAIEVKCANCNTYYPLDHVKQSGNGYYCKACYKHLKNRQCVPMTTNMEVRCARCDKIISPADTRVKDGYKVFCLRCYGLSQVPPVDATAGVKKPGNETQCAYCGRVLTPYDDKMQEGGKLYCRACYARSRPGVTSIRPDVIECAKCGMYISSGTLKEDKDGKIRCPRCGIVFPFRMRAAVKEKDTHRKIKMEDFIETAQLFKCLGDPCRVKIIELLSDHELCVFEFVEMTGYQYSAISYHLKMLKELGVVKSYERGNFMVYSLTDKGEIVHEFIEKSKGLT